MPSSTTVADDGGLGGGGEGGRGDGGGDDGGGGNGGGSERLGQRPQLDMHLFRISPPPLHFASLSMKVVSSLLQNSGSPGSFASSQNVPDVTGGGVGGGGAVGGGGGGGAGGNGGDGGGVGGVGGSSIMEISSAVLATPSAGRS